MLFLLLCLLNVPEFLEGRLANITLVYGAASHSGTGPLRQALRRSGSANRDLVNLLTAAKQNVALSRLRTTHNASTVYRVLVRPIALDRLV